MKNMQIIFFVLGIIGVGMLIAFPPQTIATGDVRFLPITDGYPIEWLKFFTWVVLDLFLAGLGIAANKREHR